MEEEGIGAYPLHRCTAGSQQHAGSALRVCDVTLTCSTLLVRWVI